MEKKVLIISTSFRGGSNSDVLAKECAKGASRSFLRYSERESPVIPVASFNTANSISVNFNVIMLLLLRFFSFFFGAIVLLPF